MSEAKSFHACQPASGEGQTNTWYTPKELVDKLGEFDLDPCTNSTRPFDLAARNIEHDKGEDGFDLDWSGRVWLNPPYGKNTEKWLRKLSAHGNGIALVFARTDTKWAQWVMGAADAVLFMKGKVSFIPSDTTKKRNTAACGSMLIAFGLDNALALIDSGIEGVIASMGEVSR